MVYYLSLACLSRHTQACITQNKIDEQLGSLPIFIAGCKTLVVLAGPSYLERLWVKRLLSLALSLPPGPAMCPQ